MTVVEKYRDYVIVEDHHEFGIFDPCINMIVKWFKSIKDCEEEVNAMED
jgi:hypothetical protein